MRFQLSFFDIFEFNKHFMSKKANFLQRYIHWIILAFFLVLLIMLLHKNAAPGASYIVLFILMVALVFIQKAFSQFIKRKAVTNYLKNNPKVMSNRDLRFNSKEIVVVIDGEETNYPFNKFTGLEETKYHYFAYTNNESAMIIPKRLEGQYPEIIKVIKKIKASV